MKTIDEINREFQYQIAQEQSGKGKRKKKKGKKEEYIEPISFPCFGMILEMEQNQNNKTVAEKKEVLSSVVSFENTDIEKTPKKTKVRRGVGKVLATLLVVLTIVSIVLAVAGVKIGVKLPVSAFCIEGDSMSDIYPDGSMLFVKKVDAKNIIVGDNLTYSRSDVFITHKVIEIFENYDGTGQRAFITQGVNNDYSDPVVTESDITGIVFGHIPGVGKIPVWLSSHVYVLIIAGAVFLTCLGVTLIIGHRRKLKALKLRTSAQPMAFVSV